jgi:hypothetical protein
MINKVKQLITADPRRPVALDIGAGHAPKVCDGLLKAGIPYFLISPEPLLPLAGEMTQPQFSRKQEGKWVLDGPGTLDTLLNSDKKPRPVIENLSAESYASAQIATVLVGGTIENIGGSGGPPDAVLHQLEHLPGLRVDVASIERKDAPQPSKPDFVFRMFATTTSGHEKELWVRVGADSSSKIQSIEEKILNAIASMRGDGAKPPPGTNATSQEGPGDGKRPKSNALVQRLSADIVAIFDDHKSPAIEDVRVSQ